jgi:hypothetical protein
MTAAPAPYVVIDKKGDSSTVTAGGLAGYTITIRNRSRRPQRLACGNPPQSEDWKPRTRVRASRGPNRGARSTGA